MKTLFPIATLVLGFFLGTAHSKGSVGFARSTGDAPVKEAGSGKARVRLLTDSSTEHAFLGVLAIDAGAGVPEHQDQTEEYVYVLEGGGVLTLDGKAHTITEGDLVFMPAGATVSYANGEASTRVLQVFAPKGPESKYDGWSSR